MSLSQRAEITSLVQFRGRLRFALSSVSSFSTDLGLWMPRCEDWGRGLGLGGTLKLSDVPLDCEVTEGSGMKLPLCLEHSNRIEEFASCSAKRDVI